MVGIWPVSAEMDDLLKLSPLIYWDTPELKQLCTRFEKAL